MPRTIYIVTKRETQSCYDPLSRSELRAIVNGHKLKAPLFCNGD